MNARCHFIVILILTLTLWLWLWGERAMANGNVHVTYHWHQHQPVYWPEYNNGSFSPGTNRYQSAFDSINLKLSDQGNYYTGSTAEHPSNQLWDGDGGGYDAVFSKADRVAAYQAGMRDSIATLGGHGNAGASISYSGSLQENIGSLGRGGYGDYHSGWNGGIAEARGWTTGSGAPKADLLGMTHHHAFGPLLPKSVLRKEIAIFREIWYKSWGGIPDKSDHSKGFWPVEAAFSRHMIPIVKEFGYEWCIVANDHLGRTCRNYLEIVPTSGNDKWNCDPPNRADRLGPAVPANQWWSGTIDGRGGTFPAPYAYRAHKAQYIDPESGSEETLVIVPMCNQLSYMNGFGSMDTNEIDDEISPFATDPNWPCLVLMAHDGDNAWGGGNSYYFQSVPDLMNAVAGKGYQPSTIQHYLNSFDHSVLDVVHVEDGSWVNAEDRGSPGFYHWCFPPQRDRASAAYDPGDARTWHDLESPGFSDDFRAWAILYGAANYLETAEQIHTDAGGTVAAWMIQEPSRTDGTNNNPNIVEQAWHFFLAGFDSGFIYYGVGLDDEIKQTLACNRALEVNHGDGSLKEYVDTHKSTSDDTPPTVFKPQRFPWNPGGMGFGNQVGYRKIGFENNGPWPSEFHIWTLVSDVSGVESVTLKVRVDLDGVNPMDGTDNETYDGGDGVGSWINIPMTRRVLDPAYNPDPNPGDTPYSGEDRNYFLQPYAMADYYFAKVTGDAVPGFRGKLLDYYIEAADSRGNTHKSEIQHVFVEDDGNGPPIETAFTMDGLPDSAGYPVSESGMVLHAAVRGDILYIATWTPGAAGGNDHFIFVGDSKLAAATTPAPWAKAGTTALPAGAAFLAAESAGDYIGWFHQGAAATSQHRSPNDGEFMEGTINLAALFGAVPSDLYLAALAYQTPDGGVLASQTPAAGSDNGNVDPDEVLHLDVFAIRDDDANGIHDIHEVPRALAVTRVEIDRDNNTLTLHFDCIPDKACHVQRSGNLSEWTDMMGTGGEPDTTRLPQINRDAVTFPLTHGGPQFFRMVQEE